MSKNLQKHLEILRKDLEAHLATLEDPARKSTAMHLAEFEAQGQHIVNKWVTEVSDSSFDGQEFKSYKTICLKFGPFAQIALSFKEAKFGIDPFETHQDEYRWYVSFDDKFVLASLGFSET